MEHSITHKFRTLSDISDEAFCKNGSRLQAALPNFAKGSNLIRLRAVY